MDHGVKTEKISSVTRVSVSIQNDCSQFVSHIDTTAYCCL